ncbi:MAG: squalene/phytoene synthase family protein [Parvularculaceae bacterium]
MNESASQLAATQGAGEGASPIAYCTSLIAQADEDLHLSLRYAAPADRPRLAALFAFQIELRRIPASVSEPALGEIRLQWHREALAEIVAGKLPRAHPVILALAATGLTASDACALEALIDARARLFYARTFTTLDDLGEFLAGAEAPLAGLALGDAGLSAAAHGLGQAHALARLAPSFAPSLAPGAAALALTLRAEHGPALSRLSPEAFGRIAYLALVRGHAVRPGGTAWPLVKRLALLAATASGRF